MLIVFLGIISLIFLCKGLHEIKYRKNAYGLTPYLFFLGSFVWGDIIVLGPFWLAVSILSLFFNDWYLFLLIISIFWSVRSLGESIYWLNEQFAAKNRNLPHTLNFHKLFQSDAIWFIYQLFWQCVLVVSVILSIALSVKWMQSQPLN